MAIVERVSKDKKTKTFWCVVRQNGKSVWVNGGHSKKAARELHDVLATKGRANSLAVARDVRFGVLVERYLMDGSHDLRSQTISTYKSRLENHLLPFFSDTRVRQSCTTEAIQRYITWQRHEKVSDKVIRASLVTLSAVLTYAVNISLLSENPCHSGKVRPPKIVDEGVEYVLSPEQVALLIQNTPKGNDRALMQFLCLTGARPLEASEARFGDVNWVDKTITIARTATRTGANAPKNGTSRVVSLAPSLVRALSGQKIALNAGSDDLCFPTVRGRRRDMSRYARDVLRPSLSRAGLPVPEGSRSAYLCRKTLISSLINNGASVKLVSDMVGSSSAQILKTYTKVRREDATDAVNRLDVMVTTDKRKRRDTQSEVAK